MRSRSASMPATQWSAKLAAGVGEQPDRLQHVVDHHRLEDVELEVAGRAADGDRRRRCPSPGRRPWSAPRDWVGLTLPGMIELPGSLAGQDQLAEAAARARAEPADVVGDLHQRGGDGLQRAVRRRPRASWAASASNLLGAVTKGRPVSSAILAAAAFGELGVGVEAGADRGAAEGELVEVGQRALDPLDAVGRAGGRSRELLAERQRRRVHQVRAADLDDVGEAPRPWSSSAVAQRGGARAAGGATVRSAAAMCIAVGKVSLDDWPRLTSSLGWIGFLRAELAAGDLDRPVGDHLVGVHVGLGAAAGLPDDQREVVVELARRSPRRRPGRSARPAPRSSSPSSALTSAAAFLSRPRARISSRGMRSVADPEVRQAALRSGRPSSGRPGPRPRPWCHARRGWP